MKRLTMWYDGNQAICEDDTCTSDCCPFADPVCDRVQQIIDRLALIEDILGDDYDLDRLRELVGADAEDRCVILPRFELPPHADPVGSPGTPGPVGHNQELVEFAEDVIRQFAYHGSVDGRPAYTAGGLSTLEEAFSIVGWGDPHPAPEFECEEEDCHEWGICGVSTPDGYKRLCIKHCWLQQNEGKETSMRENKLPRLAERLPLGIKPRHLAAEERYHELLDAICRYWGEGIEPNPEWIEEAWDMCQQAQNLP